MIKTSLSSLRRPSKARILAYRSLNHHTSQAANANKGSDQTAQVQADLHLYYCLDKSGFLMKHTVHIMLSYLCNEHPFTPHFYIVTLGFTGVYIIFLFLR